MYSFKEWYQNNNQRRPLLLARLFGSVRDWEESVNLICCRELKWVRTRHNEDINGAFFAFPWWCGGSEVCASSPFLLCSLQMLLSFAWTVVTFLSWMNLPPWQITQVTEWREIVSTEPIRPGEWIQMKLREMIYGNQCDSRSSGWEEVKR